MDERIKELAKQSGLWYVTPREDLMNDFAELIVRECVGLLEKEMEKYHDEGTPTYNLLMQESIWMKKHFGVE